MCRPDSRLRSADAPPDSHPDLDPRPRRQAHRRVRRRREHADRLDQHCAHARARRLEEPFQTPEFDEYTLVLKGSIRVEHEGGQTDVAAGQAILTSAGERIRYSTLEECEYVAVCLPAFTPDRVQREED